MFQLLNFDLTAHAYIRYRLSTQATLWHTLCMQPLERGTVHAYLPLGLTNHDLIHYAWALHSREDLEQKSIDWEYREREYEFIAKYLALPGRRLAILRGETLPMENLPDHIEAPLAIFRHRLEKIPRQLTELYYILSPDLQSEDHFRTIISSGARLPRMILLTMVPETFRPITVEQDITTEELSMLASLSAHILVGAYGDEANLIWSRGQYPAW